MSARKPTTPHAGAYGVVDLYAPDRVVEHDGGRVEFKDHMAYTDSRDLAQAAAGAVGGRFIEREEPSFGQRGAFSMLAPLDCRACREGVCTLSSHQDPLGRW